jgi:hypothetical protein
VGGTLNLYRTGGTHRFSGGLSVSTGWATFAFRVEKDIGVFTATQTNHLPIPDIRIWSGEARDVSHGVSPWSWDRNFRILPNAVTIQSAPKVGQVCHLFQNAEWSEMEHT